MNQTDLPIRKSLKEAYEKINQQLQKLVHQPNYQPLNVQLTELANYLNNAPEAQNNVFNRDYIEHNETLDPRNEQIAQTASFLVHQINTLTSTVKLHRNEVYADLQDECEYEPEEVDEYGIPYEECDPAVDEYDTALNLLNECTTSPSINYRSLQENLTALAENLLFIMDELNVPDETAAVITNIKQLITLTNVHENEIQALLREYEKQNQQK